MPLEKNTGWIDDLANRIGNTINNASGNGASGNGNNSPIEVTIKLGEETVGKTIINSINKANRRAGRQMLEI